MSARAPAAAKKRDQAGGAGRREVAPVAERRRRRADQQVAHDAAGEPDHGGEHDDAEDVEAWPARPRARR